MFSSQNFLLNVTPGDKLLKIRNTSGQLVHIIRDATCTIKQEGVMITIKQQSESQIISLDFVSIEDASTAHLLLREALKILGSLSTPPNLTAPQEYNFNPAITTTIGVTYNVTLPIAATAVHGIYVNGILVEKIYASVTLLVSGLESNFSWNDNTQYILEPTDLVTIKYN